ncbi:MAG: phosphopantothenoylcysteine decarboxylase [Planctomycetaceae bacterium]|jgi:phosphopantothenoylcysteine decarboxylase/phosphopantothenate--cysteine ligase|nr:phosphopantothenoylcysteine decarboxylase [Planctomycetaceae bacterium]
MQGREILIGVTGGIAAYKAAMLASRLVQLGAGVSVVMTKSATELVRPRTFEAISARTVLTEMFDETRRHPHIELSRAAQLLCIAPVTANFLGKMANGIADDLLSTIYLSFRGTVLAAPAMNCEMWEKKAVQRNVEQLKSDGVFFVGPESGRLSCGEIGIGRMAEPNKIIEAILALPEFEKKLRT